MMAGKLHRNKTSRQSKMSDDFDTARWYPLPMRNTRKIWKCVQKSHRIRSAFDKTFVKIRIRMVCGLVRNLKHLLFNVRISGCGFEKLVGDSGPVQTQHMMTKQSLEIIIVTVNKYVSSSCVNKNYHLANSSLKFFGISGTLDGLPTTSWISKWYLDVLKNANKNVLRSQWSPWVVLISIEMIASMLLDSHCEH